MTQAMFAQMMPMAGNKCRWREKSSCMADGQQS